MANGPFKMKAGKEGPMKKNFGISLMKDNNTYTGPKLPKKITDALKNVNKSKGTLTETKFTRPSVINNVANLDDTKPIEHFFSE